jgi:hypothetical protein
VRNYLKTVISIWMKTTVMIVIVNVQSEATTVLVSRKIHILDEVLRKDRLNCSKSQHTDKGVNTRRI